MAVGNTFGATALTSFGAFWFSFAIILMPSFGIADSYTPAEFNVAFGLFLMVRLLRKIVTCELTRSTGMVHILSFAHPLHDEGHHNFLYFVLPD